MFVGTSLFTIRWFSSCHPILLCIPQGPKDLFAYVPSTVLGCCSHISKVDLLACLGQNWLEEKVSYCPETINLGGGWLEGRGGRRDY